MFILLFLYLQKSQDQGLKIAWKFGICMIDTRILNQIWKNFENNKVFAVFFNFVDY